MVTVGFLDHVVLERERSEPVGWLARLERALVRVPAQVVPDRRAHGAPDDREPEEPVRAVDTRAQVTVGVGDHAVAARDRSEVQGPRVPEDASAIARGFLRDIPLAFAVEEESIVATHETNVADAGPFVNDEDDPGPDVEFYLEDDGTISIEPEAHERLLRLTRASRMRRRLYDFFVGAWHVMQPGVEFEPGWHVEAICDHVQCQLEDRARAVAWLQQHPGHRGDLPPGVAMRATDLAFNQPPRTLKTSIVTAATAWAWLRWPSLAMLYVSANPIVTTQSARAFRDMITSDWYRETFEPEWEVRTDQDALGSIGNTAGGVRLARGLAAKMTGAGSQWLICDDVHDLKDSAEQVQAAVEDYTSAVHNRVNDPRTSIRTLIMQRVDPGDLTAAHPWKLVVLPMEYEPGRVGGDGEWETVYGFRDPREDAWRAANDNAGVDPRTGEAYEPEVLHPRFTPTFLAAEKIRLSGTRAGYEGQMQQRPLAATAKMFRRGDWRFWKPDGIRAGDAARPLNTDGSPARVVPILGSKGGHPPRLGFDWVEVTVDCAIKDGAENDQTSIQIVGAIGTDRFVIYDWTDRRDIVAIVRDVHEVTTRAGLCKLLPSIGHMLALPQRVLVEDKASGPDVIRLLRSKVSGLEAYNPGRSSKEDRARAIVPGHRAHNYYLLEGLDWTEYVAEFEAFPKGRHDDRVDALTQFINTHVEDLVDLGDTEAGAQW